MEKYKSLINSGQIKYDHLQIEVVKQLDELGNNLLGSHNEWTRYSDNLRQALVELDIEEKNLQQLQQNNQKQEQQQAAASKQRFGWFGNSGGDKPPIYKPNTQFKPTVAKVSSPIQLRDISITDMTSKIQGFYLWGTPGCGKTFLMDLFYNQIPITQKHRIHFNQFMLNISADLHKLQHQGSNQEPLTKLARQRAQDTRLLCLDEFQITDIGDAMILKQLFQKLIEHNVVVVSTSNRKPDDLYKGGLQRHLFEPFIPYLKEKCKVVQIPSRIDYRLDESKERDGIYLYPITPEANERLDKLFLKIGGHEPVPSEIEVIKGRNLKVRRTANQVAMFSFSEICENTYGASDYIAICKNFKTIILKDIPVITTMNKSVARRFILLIDEVTNEQCNFICTAAAPISNIFEISGYIKKEGDNDVELHDEEFALERCKSRLALITKENPK